MLVLCRFVWMIEACQFFPVPSRSFSTPLYPSKMLRTKERASTPYSFVIFSLGFTFEFLKELGARLMGWTTWAACQGSNWVLQRLPHYWQTFHITNFDRIEQGKKEGTLLLFCGLQKDIRYYAMWSVVASVRWPLGGGTLFAMHVSDVCQGYCIHQPPK